MAALQDVFVPASAGTFRLLAALRFSTVPGLRQQGLELIGAAPSELTLDLSAVPSTDSAGLALLIDWLASAQASNKKLRYAQLPQPLLALARLSDVEPLLSG